MQALFVAAATLLHAARADAASPDSSLDQRLAAALSSESIPRARVLGDSALKLRERSDRRLLAVASFADSLGVRFFGVGSPEALEAAEPYFLRALTLRESALGPSDLAIANTASTLATLNDYLGRWDRGLEFERRSLAIRFAKLDSTHVRVANSRRQIGLFLFNLGRYQEAESELSRALAIYASARLPNVGRLADALNNMGEISRVQDRYEDAERHFRRGLALADSALPADDGMSAVLVNNLAGLYKDLARYDDAEPLLGRSLALREHASSPDPAALATAQLNLAEVYRLQGRLIEAEPFYARALDVSREAYGGDHPDRILFLNQAAVFYAALGQSARAETLYRETERITIRRLGPDHPLLAQTLHDLAGLLEARKDFPAAESAYTRALALRERALGPAHPEAAVTRAALARCLAGDPRAGDATAAPLLARAIAVLDSSPSYPDARLDAWSLRAQMNSRANRRADAISDMRRALAAVDSLRARRGGGEQTRAGFVAGHHALYDELMGWQLEAGDVAGAFETHERARARALLDQISASGVNLRAGIPSDELSGLDATERAARNRLAQAQHLIDAERGREGVAESERLARVARLEASRDSAAWDLGRAREALKDRSPLWRRVLSSDGRTVSIADIQGSLVPAGTVLIEYHIGEARSWAFVIPSRGRPPSAFALSVDAEAAKQLGIPEGPITTASLEQVMVGRPDARPLAGRVGLADELSGKALPQVARVFGPSSEPDRRELRLHALWRVLAPPAVWTELRRADHAVIAPDGALHLLPFEALVVMPRRPGREVRYWLDDGPASSYAASATSLLSLERRAVPRRSNSIGSVVLSVSDARFDVGEVPASGSAPGSGPMTTLPRFDPSGRKWRPLPGTRVESERLVRAFAPEKVEVLAGAAATEQAVRASLAGKRFVHIATHGFVTETRGDLLAGLVLSPPTGAGGGNADDGLLQLYEIYELPLDCDLAVLSACETHRGPRVPGEGVFALSRGFLAAGSRGVVASLWAVEDLATAELVADTFDGIAAGYKRGRDSDVAVLLRDAKRRVRAHPSWSDPRYWAAFVLTGTR